MNSQNDPNAHGSPNACDPFSEDLTHFVLGELTEERRPALEHHLVACAACRAERDLLARSVELVKRDADAKAPVLELSTARREQLLAQAALAQAGPAQTAPAEAGDLATAAPILTAPATRFWTAPRLALAATVLVGVPLAGAAWWSWQDDKSPGSGMECATVVVSHVGGAEWVDEAAPKALETSGDTFTRSPPSADPDSSTAIVRAGADESLFFDDVESLDDSRTESDTTIGFVEAEAALRKLDAAKDPTATTDYLGPADTTPPNPGGASTNPPGNPSGPETPPPNLGVAGGPTTGGPGVPGAGGGRGMRGGAPHAKRSGDAGEARGEATKSRAGQSLAGRAKKTSPQQPEPKPEAETVELTEELARQLDEIGYARDGGGGGGGATPIATASGESLTPEDRDRLRSLGSMDADAEASVSAYLYLDGANGESIRLDGGRLDANVLAALLANGNSPTDLLALQPQLRVALAFDPGTPADGDRDQRSRELVREFLDRLAPRQGETPRDMFFRYFGDHPFVSTRIDAKSTFGMDVDTASYNLVRAYLGNGNLPPKAAVRTEEFVNAFEHDLAPPSEDGAEVFAIRTELAPSPFGDDGSSSGRVMLQVGLKAREISKSKRRPVALTFVIDVSGSMEEGGRLELVKRSLVRLIDQLDERDTIGIVVFSTRGRRVLDPTNAAQRTRIVSVLDQLRPDGSTNADEGLRLGYDLALEQLRSNAENRVILCSDGVANTGITDGGTLVARIRECKTKDLYLNCIGVGMNNHNDALLEQLADEGDGFCAYVDRDEEAKEIFVEKLSGTLITVARDAKIQVEFDPASVRRFRQLGYENRALAHRDFRNDRVDAGEVGAGHEVVALYELELKQGALNEQVPLATVRCRYQEPRTREIIEQVREVYVAEAAATATSASPRFRLAVAVAEFAEILRQSIHARDGSLADVQRFAEPLVAELAGDPDVPEFVALVKQAARLPDLLPRRTELVRAVDEIKRVRCWQEEMRELRSSDPAEDAANSELMRQLEEQNRRLEEALRDALERSARGS